jgi:Fe-S cluster assembly protein SufD
MSTVEPAAPDATTPAPAPAAAPSAVEVRETQREASRRDEIAPWLVALEALRRKGEPEWLAAQRDDATARFARLGFPTTRDEAWRQTSVAALARTRFDNATRGALDDALESMPAFRFGGAFAGREAVFVNGRFMPELSSLGKLARVRVRPLRQVLADDPDALCGLIGAAADDDKHPFLALNLAAFQDGAVVEVPERYTVHGPIHLLFISTGGAASHPRVLIGLNRNSQATVVESYVSPRGAHSFCNAATEVLLGDGAVLDHVRLQAESEKAYHVATTATRVSRSATYRSHALTLGAALSRHDLGVRLEGEGADVELHGLFVSDDAQLHDTHSKLDHVAPHGTSREVYKGVLGGRARGVKNGLIVVRPGAQKTDAQQQSRNLLLSREALVHATPQLLIHADDVKCKHGATTGQIEDAPLFYLRSRGLDEEAARALLVWAFAADVVSKLKVAPVRESVERFLRERLPAAGAVPGTRA